MHFQFIVAPPTPALTPAAPPTVDSTTELLRQILEIQKQQLALFRETRTEENLQARWRSFLLRWKGEFGHLPSSIAQIMPSMERAFLNLLDSLTNHLMNEETENLSNEFFLSEFLDRFANRTGQLGTLLSFLGQIVEATQNKEL